MHDQVICSDSVKPMESRRGWSLEQLNNYNRERFEDLISASWDLVIIDEDPPQGAAQNRWHATSWVQRWPKRRPIFCCCRPHRAGKTHQFLRLMQLLDRGSLPRREQRESRPRASVSIRTESLSINADGQPPFKPRVTRFATVAWQARHNFL